MDIFAVLLVVASMLEIQKNEQSSCRRKNEREGEGGLQKREGTGTDMF